MQIDLKKLTPPPLANSTCTECGALVPAELQLRDAFLLFFLSDFLKFASPPPRLLIDAFAMQHPKRACKSAKSYATHFTGLCCGVEYGGSEKVYTAIERWLNDSAERIDLVRPQEPGYRGHLTLRQLYDADSPASFEPRQLEWGTDAWDAYALQHEIARRWIEAALKSR